MRQHRNLLICSAALLLAAGCSRPNGAVSALVDGAPTSGAFGAECSSCHGSAENPAPPTSLKGLTATTELAVGAHQTHLRGGLLRAAIACQECHVVPGKTNDPGHLYKDHADVTFGPLASANGSTPSWDRQSATCATYCHGATMKGGVTTAPVWTRVDGTQASCGTCHGIPPPPESGHPAVAKGMAGCIDCHADTVRADGSIDVAGGKHIDGQVQVSGVTCTSCHGSTSSIAPPHGTHGETATTTLAVGAHQSHLNDSAIRQAVACSECHLVPSSPTHSNGVVDLTFGPLATTAGAQPSFDASQATCASTYCHGSTLNAGGSNTTPIWTRVDGTQAACGTCHGLPPPASTGHPTVTSGLAACVSCHPDTMNADGTVNVAGGKHMNGVVDAAGLSCTSCHGDATRSTNPAAPPKGTKGETATTARAVGAHQSHLTANALRVAVSCSECHLVPTSTSHSTGTATVTFGAVANTGTASSWNGTTCATYCHGATLTGGTNNNPTWTKVDGTQAACGSCHGIAPATGQHGRSAHQSAGCVACHAGYSATSVNTANHINGKKDLGGALIQTYDPSTRSCAPACHGTQTW